MSKVKSHKNKNLHQSLKWHERQQRVYVNKAMEPYWFHIKKIAASRTPPVAVGNIMAEAFKIYLEFMGVDVHAPTDDEPALPHSCEPPPEERNGDEDLFAIGGTGQYSDEDLFRLEGK